MISDLTDFESRPRFPLPVPLKELSRGTNVRTLHSRIPFYFLFSDRYALPAAGLVLASTAANNDLLAGGWAAKR